MKLCIKNLCFSYNSVPVLNEVGLKLNSGEILGLIGPNGSGKSTLLKCIDRILRPVKGSVLINGEDISSLGRKELAQTIGYVPQQEEKQFPATVFDTVLTGRKPYITWRETVKDREVVKEILERIGLAELAMRDIMNLSGGELQKVALARALAQEPDVLLLDEPTSNLDLKHQLEVLNIVQEEVLERSISSVLAIHDLNLASRYADKFVLVKEGSIFAAGGQEVFSETILSEVYEVQVKVIKNEGLTLVLPQKPINGCDSVMSSSNAVKHLNVG